MVGLLDDPLIHIGLGLLSAGGPSAQPQSIGQGLLRGLQQAQHAQALGQQAKMTDVQSRLLQMQADQAQRREQAVKNFGQSLQPTQPGLDPGTGITWDTARQGVPQLPGMTPELSRYLSAMPADDAYSIYQQTVAKQLMPATPVKLGAGESLVDPRTGQVKTSLPEKPPSGFRIGPDGKWMADPAWLEAETALRRAAVNPTTINMPPNERAFEKTYGEALGKRAEGDLSAAEGARKSLAQLDRLDALTRDFRTGKLAPVKSTVAAWAQELGADPKQLGLDPNAAMNAQGVEAITNAMTVGMIGAGGFPANNFSDADRAFLQKTMPAISNTPGGNAIISQAMRQGYERTIEKEQQWLKARAENKSYEQFMQDWNRHVQNNPLFPRFDDNEAGRMAYSRLRPGSVFTAPDGSVRVKQ